MDKKKFLVTMLAAVVTAIILVVIQRGPKEVIVKSDEQLTRVVDYPAVDLAEGTKVSVR